MNRGELEQRIRLAFADVSYPGDDNIGDPDGRDDAEDVAHALKGKSWRNLARRKDLHHLSLYFMTPVACQYYLPAYLLVAMKSPYGQAMRGVKLRLKPYEGPYDPPKEIFSMFIGLLLPTQKRVIVDFLIYSRSAVENFCLDQERREIKEREAEGYFELKDLRDSHWRSVSEDEKAEFNLLIKYWNKLVN
jgi:hypothetical protein